MKVNIWGEYGGEFDSIKEAREKAKNNSIYLTPEEIEADCEDAVTIDYMGCSIEK